jgi:hypothetical protein
MGITKSKFPKIIVSKHYEVENGILGLERDMYLNIGKYFNIKMLDKLEEIFIFKKLKQ